MNDPSSGEALLGWSAIVVGASAWFHPVVAGSDLWWQLAAGREIVRSGGLPVVDIFSHTAAGAAWTNHEWLWEILYWAVYGIHPDAVACFNLFIITTVFVLAACIARRESGSLLAAGAATWAAAAASHWFLDIRPHIFSLLFVAVLLLTREKRWAPWLWPPLFLVWVNLHGGFVFGLGVVGLYVLFRTWEASRDAGKFTLPRRDWTGLVAAALVTLANPYGWRILEYPLAYLDSSSLFREQLVEWQPPGFDLDPRGFEGRFAIMVALAALGASRGIRRAPFLAALAGVACLMALTSRRFIPLFCVVSVPLAATGLAWLVRFARDRLPARLLRPASWAAAATALVAGLLLWSGVRFFPHPLYRWTQSETYPTGAVEYMRLLPDPPRRLFNFYDWGGYLMLHAPEIPVFIDSRANTLYGEAFYREYREIESASPGFESILAAYEVDAVLAHGAHPVIRQLQRRTGDWRIAYADANAVLLLPADTVVAGSLPDPVEALPPGPQRMLSRGWREQRQGDLDLARDSFAAAVDSNPLLIPAYAQLILIAERRGDAAAIERWTDAAVRAYPRQAWIIRGKAGRSYARLGDLDAALDALRKAVPRGPFSSPDRVRAEIRAVETRLLEESRQP